MPPLAHRLRLVKQLGDAAATAALADALEFAEEEECAAIASALVERSCASALSTLIRRWDHLDAPARGRVVELARQSPAVVSAAAHVAAVSERRHALELIARLGLTECVDAAVANLNHSDPAVSLRAASAIDGITVAHLARPNLADGRDADDQRLDAALALALDGYPKHRQGAVLVAAARMLHAPGAALRRWLADREHPTHMAMRGFMKRLPDAELAPMLLDWLGIDSLGAQALEHVARLAVTPHCGPMIRGKAHLLALPEQGSRLRRLDPRRPAAPPSAVALKMDDEAQGALPAWILAVPMPDEQRLLRLADGASFRSPRARLGAFRALVSLEDARADAIIVQFCFDGDARLARLAASHCVRRRVEGLSDLLRRLLRSPHRSVRTLAVAHSSAADFESIWTYWAPSSGPTIEQRIEAKLVARDELEAFARELRRRLTSGDRDSCLRAVRVACDLHVLGEVELELLTLSRSDDVRIAATAIKALGQLDSTSSRGAVVAGLQHADVRTRANAIEVLAPALIEVHRQTLDSISQSPDNRPRANAITAIAQVDRADAAAKLDRMLGDARPLHRLSALWATEAVAMTQCASRVANLARQDVSPPVRERARRTARRLLAAMSTRQPDRDRAASNQAKIKLEPGEVEALQGESPRPASAAAWIVPLFPTSLAQSSSRLSEISRSFVDRQSAWPTLSWDWLAPALAATGVLAATLIALRWSIRDAQRHGPGYRALAAGLDLTGRQRRLLQTVAVHSGRVNAAGLLLSRGTFDHHVDRWRETGVRATAQRLERLAAIRSLLFS